SRCALAAVATDPVRLLRVAEGDAARLGRVGTAWAEAYAALTRSGIAATKGDSRMSAELLADAARRFDAVDMMMDATATRRRLGEVIGGVEGASLKDQADDWMLAKEIRRPDSFAAAFAPDCTVRGRT